MNNNLVVPDNGPWPFDNISGATRRGGQRTYSGAHILDFPTLLRIVLHWRWLILGAVALGLVAAIILNLLTTPVYRVVGDAGSQSADGLGVHRTVA